MFFFDTSTDISLTYKQHIIIYAGTQRIASKLGDIEAFGADPRRVVTAGHDVDNAEPIDFGTKYKNQNDAFKSRFDSLGAKFNGKSLDDYVNGKSFCCSGKNLDEIEKNNTQSAENAKIEDNLYFYHPDHLGSTSMVTNYDGEVSQNIAYIPYGEVFVEERNGNWASPFLFNAKELDEETGLYYYGARYLDPTDCRWLSVDPKWDDYKGVSPYAYCLNNPVKLTDPNGEDVEADELSQENIKKSLTIKEAKYVRFDKNGTLDKKMLSKSKSTSKNMSALKKLADSELVYSFHVVDKDHEGEKFQDDNKGNFYKGITEMPNAETKSSPDEKIYILVGGFQDEEQQVLTTAHEAYGHGYFYELYRNVSKANIRDESICNKVWDEELQMDVIECIFVNTNQQLEDRIKEVVNEAKNNYESRSKTR